MGDGTIKIGTEIDDTGLKKDLSGLQNTFKKGLSGLGSVTKAGFAGMATGIKAIAGASTAAVGSLAALGAATAEYRDEQAKLNTAFQAAGYSTETAKQAYNDFYAILGESDTAVEASQLLAKLATSEQDMAEWTNIAAGVWGTFGDALPIESLIESANETAKVGEVTGSLADALNWAGISEEEFNKKLASAGSEAERNQLIMSTLSGEYENAANIFKENNATLMESRNVQAQLMESLGGLGEAVNNISNQLMISFGPSITAIIQSFTDLINGVAGADEQLATAIGGFITKITEQLPQFLTLGSQILTALISGIGQNLPMLAETALTLLNNLGQYIVENLPAFFETATQIITGIQQSIIDNLPLLIETAMQIIESLGNGLVENLPIILENATTITMQLVDGLIKNLPMIIKTGIEILVTLIEGIAKAIPQLIPAAVEAILTIVEALIDNLDLLIDAAIDIILALAFGLIDAIPLLIEKVPVIITKLVLAFKDPAMQMKLLDAGLQLIIALIEGIIKSTIAVAQAAWDIGQEIVNSILEFPGRMLDVGKDLIKGLIDGIKSMGKEVFNTLKDFCGGIVDDVKSFFGIHSPSRVMRDKVGVWLSRGLAVGIESENDKVVGAITAPFYDAQEDIKKQESVFSKNISSVILKAQKDANKKAKNFGETGDILVTSLTDNINKNKENAINSMTELIDEMLENSNKNIDEKSQGLIDNYTNTINAQIKNNTLSKEAGEKLIKDYTDAVKNTAEEEKEELSSVGNNLMDSFKNSLETGATQINEMIEQKLGVMTDNFQKEMDNLISAQESLESKLADTKLFEFDDNGVIIANLDETINKLNQYDQVIANLKDKGISDAILDELAGYSVDEVLAISETLLAMTDEEFATLNKKWAEKQAAAATVASNFYKEQMEVLEKDFNDELLKVLNELPDEVEDIGIMTITGFENGLSSKFDTIKEQARSFADSIAAEMSRALNTSSSSSGSSTYSMDVGRNAKSMFGNFKNIPMIDSFKSQLGYVKNLVASATNSMIPKAARYINNTTTNSNVTNRQGDFIVNISGVELKNGMDVKSLLQELSFYQQQRDLATGGAR